MPAMWSLGSLRRQTAAILIVTLAALTPAALASPPDPTWIAGLYDDGDHDDVILLVLSTSATPVARTDVAVWLDLAPDRSKLDTAVRIAPGPVRMAFEGRAPPIA